MRKLLLSTVLLIFTSLSFVSCSTEEDGIYFEKITESKSQYSAMEVEILNLVNNYRKAKGLTSLKRLNIVSSVAQSHSKYMVEEGTVSHDNFPQRNENLVHNASAKRVGENVAYGYGTAKGVVNAWIKSDGHRAVIENEDYTHFGISTEKNSEGRNYFTQMFIEK